MNDEYWKGDAGDEYHMRNVGRVDANHAFFRQVLHKAGVIDSIIEFGAGRGENLEAIHRLLRSAELWGVELNEFAAQQINVGNVIRGSMFHVEHPQCDLAFTKGLLIHIPQEQLQAAYEVLYRASKRYILIAEYFSPTPVEVEYRGRNGLLWKRDFAGEMLDRFPDLTVVDYGFSWKRMTGQDNLNWALLSKERTR